MNDFKRLLVWKFSFALAKKIYTITLTFPREEIYGLTSQIRRSAVSIFSNIAEGCGRNTDKDFRHFLFNSMGSLRELETQLLFAKEVRYINQKEFEPLAELIDQIGAKLNRLIQSLS